MTRMDVYGSLILLILFALGGCRYYPEATFELAKQSRLPRWFESYVSADGGEFHVEMNYYVEPGGKVAEFLLKDKNNKVQSKVISDKIPEAQLSNYYPMRLRVTVNGVTETIEHKKMEPLFYIIDTK